MFLRNVAVGHIVPLATNLGCIEIACLSGLLGSKLRTAGGMPLGLRSRRAALERSGLRPRNHSFFKRPIWQRRA